MKKRLENDELINLLEGSKYNRDLCTRGRREEGSTRKELDEDKKDDFFNERSGRLTF